MQDYLVPGGFCFGSGVTFYSDLFGFGAFWDGKNPR